jgi:hypothetical protein
MQGPRRREKPSNTSFHGASRAPGPTRISGPGASYGFDHREDIDGAIQKLGFVVLVSARSVEGDC